MINSLDMASISHFGIDRESPLEARRKAALQFSKVLSRGLSRNFWRKLFGMGNNLLTLADIPMNSQRHPAQAGIVNIPLSKIVGSEGRTNDFDREFNPLKSHIRDRWIGIAVARRRGIPLPPIELIQYGHSYYIRDGNHRVSVAKAAGQVEIEARVLYAIE